MAILFGHLSGLRAALASIIMFVIWLIMSVAALLMLLLSRIGLAVLVATGPIFIGLAIHPATREYFTKWLSYCTNFAFLAMLVGGVLAMVRVIAQGQFDTFSNTSGDVSFITMAAPALIMGAVIGMFSQLPNVASSLGGGIGISAGNVLGAAASRGSAPLRRGLDRATGGEGRQAKREARQSVKRLQARRNLARKDGS